MNAMNAGWQLYKLGRKTCYHENYPLFPSFIYRPPGVRLLGDPFSHFALCLLKMALISRSSEQCQKQNVPSVATTVMAGR